MNNDNTITEQVEISLNDLTLLGFGNLYRIDRIEWWCLKYSEFYLFCDSRKLIHDFLKPDFNPQKCLCCAGVDKEERDFCEFYECLDEITKIHRLENYCKIQFDIYKDIQSDRNELRNWVIENEETGKILLCFFLDYLDYDLDQSKLLDLIVTQFAYESMQLFIERKDFKSIIEFKEIFDHLYWVEEIYPEPIARIEEEMKQDALKRKNQD